MQFMMIHYLDFACLDEECPLFFPFPLQSLHMNLPFGSPVVKTPTQNW
jgi:hypothetical protein